MAIIILATYVAVSAIVAFVLLLLCKVGVDKLFDHFIKR